MAYSLGDLVVRIIGDDTDFQAKTKGVEKTADRASTSVGKSFDGMKLKSIAMGIAASAAVVKTIGFLKDSAKAAIDAQETFSKFDVVFSGMESAAESAAKQFQDSFDLAGVTAKKMLSDTGNLLTGFGATKEQALELSVSVNTLASDLASFTNYSGGAEGASQALTKAMLGERESIKQLGIVIREEDINQKLLARGQQDLTGNALNLAKAQATLEIAMEQGKNAIGDYQRTHDSAANTLKRAKEATTELQVAIGTALSPSVSLLGSLWATVAEKLAAVIAERNRLKDAEDAEGTAADTTELKIARLQQERKELEANVAVYKQYDTEGRIIRSQALDDAEKELKANEVAIKGLQLRLQYETQAENQRASAQQSIARWSEDNKKRDKSEADRLAEIAKQKQEINSEFLAATQKLNWEVDNGLISEQQEREGIVSALEKQINALYDLSVATGNYSLLNSKAMQDAQDHLARLKDVSGSITEAEKISIDEITSIVVDGIGNLAGAFSGLYSALADKQIEELDRAMEAQLEAEGLAEESKYESLQRQYEEAVAAGDAENAEKLKAEARKAQIEEEYEKKRLKVKYKAEKAAWQMSLIQAIVEGARAIQVAVSSAPWPYNIPAIAFAAGTSAVQLATIQANAPTPPALASGGIAEPTNGGAVVQVAENNAGEVMFNTGETGQAFIEQMGGAIARNLNIVSVLQVGEEELARVVARPINDGRVRLNP